MKKILSYFAFAAVILSFAACNNNDPEQNGKFVIKADASVNTLKVSITPANASIWYYWNMVSKEDLHAPIAEYAQGKLQGLADNGYTYEQLKKKNVLAQGNVTDFSINGLDPATEYVIFACEVDPDLKVVGEVSQKTFSTARDDTPKTVAEAKEQLRMWGEITSAWSEYLLYELGKVNEAYELQKHLDDAIEVYRKEDASLEELIAAINDLKAVFAPYAKDYFLVSKEQTISDMDIYLQDCDSPTCQQIVQEGKDAAAAINWDDSKSWEQVIDLLMQLTAIDDETDEKITLQLS